MLTEKQREVVECIKTEDPKILICDGAKRAGKTFVLDLAFLAHIAKFKNKGLNFIIGGATQASIRRNILDDLENITFKELKLDKNNCIKVFGNKVYCFDGSNADAWKKVRGFTSAGAFLNEGTALHNTFIKEVLNRCSYPGARIYIDTNPENPSHPLKTDYIDNDGQRLKNGRLNIKTFNFTLFDNTTLDPEYVESIVKSTPSGMFTDRDIYGRWVTAEGIVYQDFNENRHYISREQAEKMTYNKYAVGVDWGYEHWGTMLVVGFTDSNKKVLLSEYAAQHKEIDFWVDTAKSIVNQYGNINFYCDSARPEHIARLQRERIRAYNADKSVLSGIEQVAKGFKTDELLIVNDVERFKAEINQYCWNERTGEPIKRFDDVLDALRYVIYTDYKNSQRADLSGIVI